MITRPLYKIAVLCVLAILGVCLPVGTAMAQSGTTSRISTTTTADTESDGACGVAMTADGNYIVFESGSDQLVPNDTNNAKDIFVFNRQTSKTSRVSVSSSGTQANGNSFDAAISANGRYVVFTSRATNLVASDTNDVIDVFVHDRQTHATVRASVSSPGIEGNSASSRPQITGDGRYVVFESLASNLVEGDGIDTRNVFLFDTQTKETFRISSQLPQGLTLSPNGKYLAYMAGDSADIPDDINQKSDLFIYRFEDATLKRIELSIEENHGSSFGVTGISGNGRFVVFNVGSFIEPGYDFEYADILVYDVESKQINNITLSSSGAPSDGNSYDASITDDGRYVVFLSVATNLVAGTSPRGYHIYLHDRTSKKTSFISKTSGGHVLLGNDSAVLICEDGSLKRTAVSQNGKLIAFATEFGLTPDDSNSVVDVYLRDLTKSPQYSTLSGRVTYTTGEPIPNVTVYTFHEQAHTSANGEYSFNLPSGTYQVITSGSAVVPTRIVTLPPNQTNVDFQIPRAAFEVEWDGYSFVNMGRRTNWEIFKATYGAEYVERVIGGKTVRLPAALDEYNQKYCKNKDGVCTHVGMGGNCFGMALTSALFHRDWEETNNPRATEGALSTFGIASPPVFREIPNKDPRLWVATTLTDWLVRYQGYQYGRQYSSDSYKAQSRSVKANWEVIKASLDNGLAEPMIIGIAGYRGMNGNMAKCSAHAVVPVSYTMSGNVVTLSIYNPNKPGMLDSMQINPSINFWAYNMGSVENPDFWQTNAACGVGFLALPVSTGREPPIPRWVPSGGEDANSNLAVATIEGANIDLQVVDALGNQLGWSNGNLLQEIPTAAIHFPISYLPENPIPSEPQYIVPTDVELTYNLSYQDSQAAGIQLISPGNITSITNKAPVPNSTDTVVRHADSLAFGITTQSPATTNVLSTIIVDGNTQSELTVSNLRVDDNEETQIEFSPAADVISITLPIAQSGVRVKLYRIDTHEVEATFALPSMVAGARGVMLINWEQPGVVIYKIDEDHDGLPERTETLVAGAANNVYLPSVARP